MAANQKVDEVVVRNLRMNQGDMPRTGVWSFDVSVHGRPFFQTKIHVRENDVVYDLGPAAFCLSDLVRPTEVIRDILSDYRHAFNKIMPPSWDIQRRTLFFRDLFNTSIRSGATFGRPIALMA